MLHFILKCHLHTASENWLRFLTETYEAGITARYSSKVRGSNLAATIANCRSTFFSLLWTYKPSVIPEAMHLGFIFLWAMRYKSVVGEVDDGYLERGKETLWVSMLCFRRVSYRREISHFIVYLVMQA